MDLKAKVNRSYLSIITVAIAAFVLIGIVSLSIFITFKKELASVAVDQSHSEFIRGDFRNALASINNSMSEHFESIEFLSRDHGTYIRLPPESSRGLASYSFVLSVKPDGFQESLGTLTFTVNLNSVLLFNFLTWLIGAVIQMLISQRIKTALQQKYREQSEADRAKAISDLSLQVAHDIRSPLAVLTMAQSESSETLASNRLLIRSAILQINKIAQTLLDASRNSLQVEVVPSAIELISFLSEVTASKRWEIRSRDVLITFNYPDSLSSAFVEGNITDLRSVFSNILNNAIEAMPLIGTVIISLNEKDAIYLIRIRDNGKGIPRNIIPSIGKRGFTSGKKDGNGFGLAHAFNVISTLGGGITVESEINAGTEVAIILPKANTPNWFFPDLILAIGSTVVIVDEDHGIHEVWKNRDRVEELADKSIKLVYFSCVDQFSEYLNTLPESVLSSTQYFLDLDLMSGSNSWADIAGRYGIADRTTLVTSHADSPEVQSACDLHSMGLLSKSRIATIPIKFRAIPGSDFLPDQELILLDNDRSIIKIWSLAAKKKSLRLTCFESGALLFQNLNSFSRNVKIFIDSDLGDGIRGEVIAKKLHSIGYENLFLCTGHHESNVKSETYLKGIVGKLPPWL